MALHHVVLAHRDPAQVSRLVGTLARARGRVVLHVDATVDPAPFTGAYLVPDPVAVNWGGFSIVAATLAAMETLEPSVADDDHVVLLSGDSYPVRPPEAIEKFLTASGGAQFLNQVPMPSAAMNKPLTRLSRRFVEYGPQDRPTTRLLRRGVNALRVPQRVRLSGLVPHGGSQWWALTGEALRWVTREVRRDPALVRFAARTRVPDEWFFQTLLMGSPFAGDVRPSMMFSDFSGGGTSPALLDDAHVEALEQRGLRSSGGYGSGPIVYARKFSGAAPDVLAAVESRLWPLDLDLDRPAIHRRPGSSTT